MLQIQPQNFNDTAQIKQQAKMFAVNTNIKTKQVKDAVSFSGREKDLLDMTEEQILEKLESALKPENKLGEGGESRVYKIPQTNYVLRIRRNLNKFNGFADYKNMLSFDLSVEDKINHTVAKLGEDSSIMTFLPGTNCFLYKNKKELFNLPFESYYNLYKQMCFAKENDMIFDCCAANLIYNPQDKSLTAIDFYKDNPDFILAPRSPLHLIFSAINSSVTDIDSKLRKNLLGSLLNIALKEFEPGVKPVQDITQIHVSSLFRSFENHNKEKMPAQYGILKRTMKDIKELKLKELRGQEVTVELNGKIKVAKSIVKQILTIDNTSLLSRLKLWDCKF